MLALNQRLQLRNEEIAAKVIDGEAIIINLSNGVYYSTDRAGAVIWDAIQNRRSLEQAVAAVLARYDVGRDQVERDVERMAQEFLQEELVVISDEPGDVSIEPAEDVETRMTYEVPKLNIYRDMGDLLALDPPTPGLGDSPWKDPAEESTR